MLHELYLWAEQYFQIITTDLWFHKDPLFILLSYLPIVLFQIIDVDDFIVDDEGNPINRHTKKKRRIPGTLQDS